MVVQAGSQLCTYISPSRASRVPPLFDGGLFANGGFEDGLNGWLQSSAWTATVDADTAENPATGTNQVLFQNFTLEDGATYSISADYISGDATINYVINDVDSGIAIGTSHTFVAIATAVSIGVGITTIGTVKSVVDSLRLTKIADANVVTYEGEAVTYNGVPVTYIPGA